MAERFTPNGVRLSSDQNPPRARNAVLAELIAHRIYDLAPKWCSTSGDLGCKELAASVERMLDEGTLKAQLEGE